MSQSNPQGQGQQKQAAPKVVYRVHPHGALDHNGKIYPPGARAPDLSEEDRLALGSVIVASVD